MDKIQWSVMEVFPSTVFVVVYRNNLLCCQSAGFVSTSRESAEAHVAKETMRGGMYDAATIVELPLSK